MSAPVTRVLAEASWAAKSRALARGEKLIPTFGLRVSQFHLARHIPLGLGRRLLPGYLAYYRRDFHPSDNRNEALLDQWRERLFSDGEVAIARPTP